MNRRDVDDRAAPRPLHRTERVLRAQPRAFQIDGEDAVPFRFGHVDRIEVRIHPRVVHQDVEPSMAVDDGGNRAPHVGLARDVGRRELHRQARGRQLAGGRLSDRRVDVDKRDLRAFGAEFLDDAAADATGAARDEGDPASQASHPGISLQRCNRLSALGFRL